MRVVFELKRDANAQVVLNNLFKHTQMQTTFGVIMLAIVQNRPRTMNLKELLEKFLAFRKEVVTRRTLFLLRKAEARAHPARAFDRPRQPRRGHQADPGLEGPEGGEEGLVAKFGLSEIQAQAILDMRLQRLTGLEREKILQELKEVRAEIARLKKILGEEAELLRVIGSRDPGRLRRRPPFRDPARDEGPAARGPDRGRGDGGHRFPHGVHQAEPDQPLPDAAARGAREGRHGDEGGGFRLDALLSPRCTPTSSSSRTRGRCTG